MHIKIKILSWIFQLEISLKKREIDYKIAAKNCGWFLDLPAPGQPKLRFAKYEYGMGIDFSYVSTWEELCTEQNIKGE
jgi:hypothetical protein